MRLVFEPTDRAATFHDTAYSSRLRPEPGANPSFHATHIRSDSFATQSPMPPVPFMN